MSVPIIAFFNSKQGVGTTSLVYHLAWMFSDLRVTVLAVDMDPQANLTTAFIGDAMPGSVHNQTLGISDSLAHVVNERLILAPNDLQTAAYEEEFAIGWQRALDGDEQSFGVVCRPWHFMRMLARICRAQLILVDLGPNLSAMNRTGLIAADYVVIPLTPDSLSVIGLNILGSTLGKWRGDWRERVARNPAKDMELPAGEMRALGYVVQQPGLARSSIENWIDLIPEFYWKSILDVPLTAGVSILNDPEKLAVLRPYRTLLEMPQEARKPMFHLKPSDGALGAHLKCAKDARKDYEALAGAIVAKARLPIVFAR